MTASHELHVVTSAVFSVLEASHRILPPLKGRTSTHCGYILEALPSPVKLLQFNNKVDLTESTPYLKFLLTILFQMIIFLMLSHKRGHH